MIKMIIKLGVIPVRKVSEPNNIKALWNAPIVLKAVSVGRYSFLIRLIWAYSVIRFRVTETAPLRINHVGEFAFETLPKNEIQAILEATKTAVQELRRDNWEDPAKSYFDIWDRYASTYLKHVMIPAIDRLLFHIGHSQMKLNWQ